MFIALAAASALFYGLGDFSGGYAAGKSKVLSVLVVSQACGLATALLAVAVMVETGTVPRPQRLRLRGIRGCGRVALARRAGHYAGGPARQVRRVQFANAVLHE